MGRIGLWFTSGLIETWPGLKGLWTLISTIAGLIWLRNVSYVIMYSPVDISQKIVCPKDDENHKQQNNDRAVSHCNRYHWTAYFDSLSEWRLRTGWYLFYTMLDRVSWFQMSHRNKELTARGCSWQAIYLYSHSIGKIFVDGSGTESVQFILPFNSFNYWSSQWTSGFIRLFRCSSCEPTHMCVLT